MSERTDVWLVQYQSGRVLFVADSMESADTLLRRMEYESIDDTEGYPPLYARDRGHMPPSILSVRKEAVRHA